MTEAEAILVIGISALAIWSRDRTLYFVGAFVVAFVGYPLVETNLTLGIAVLGIALYLFGKAVWRIR